MSESWGQEPRRAALCTCGWAHIFHSLRVANTAIERHKAEGCEGCDHAVRIEELARG